MSTKEGTNADNPYDIDGSKFDAELYMDRLLRLGSLRQVLDKEAEIVTQSQCLQSEMQTLVYENYNKFISATDTVRQMRADFRGMREDMDKLTADVETIFTFGAQVSDALRDSSGRVGRLCATRRLLDRLQFLFLLPTQLSEAVASARYGDAVRDYTHAQKVLQRYGSHPSFGGIHSECEEIISQLRLTLRERLVAPETSAAELAESASLLVQLGGWDGSLECAFLECAESRLRKHLQRLSCDTQSHYDVLEWIERANTGLLPDLTLIVSSYLKVFASDSEEVQPLSTFTNSILDEYFNLTDKVLRSAAHSGTEILSRALDKFFRHVQAMKDSVPSDSLVTKAADLVRDSIQYKGDVQGDIILEQFKETLMTVRKALASKAENQDLKENLNSLQVQLIEKVQASLLDLTVFLQKDLSFGLKPWCVAAVSHTCWKIISQTVNNVSNTVKSFSTPQSSNNSVPSELLLLLAKLCLELQDSGVSTLHAHMVKLVEEASPGARCEQRDASSLAVALATAAQGALDAHVAYVGHTAAQMLRVSVLARDWLRAPEPRAPRAVCRRVVEALAAADAAAAQLFPAGTRQSSDSSRRTLWPRAPSFSPINRIFSERIEVFGPAGADRAALSTGALKVALKALVECVRLRTFGRHGLQQLQVDVHFLQQRLACVARDERLLCSLLDDALASARLRCVEPHLMEPSVVDVVCERG